MVKARRAFRHRCQTRQTSSYLEALEQRTLLSGSLASGGALSDLMPQAGVVNVGSAATALPSTTLTLSLASGGTACAKSVFHITATGAPSGLVDLFEGSVWRGAANMVNGSADLEPPLPLHGGTHVLTAHFYRSATAAPATSEPLVVDFTAIPTSTTLTTSLASVPEIQAVTLTAQVSSTAQAVGRVSFYDQNTLLGTVVVDASGKAVLSRSFASFGTHLLTARYQGTRDLQPSESAGLSQVVLRTPRHLVFTRSIATVAAGDAFDLAVGVTDCLNTLISGNTCSISLCIVAMTGGGALQGTTTVRAVDGIATLAHLSISKPGTYTVRAASGTTLFGDLGGIVVTPPATHLGFVPAATSSTVAGQVISPMTVQFLDASNHLVPMNVPVTIALTKANGATLAGTRTVTALDGTAVFNDLSLTQAGNYTLSAVAGNVRVGTSKTFTILPDAATAHLVIAAQPANVALDQSMAITVNIVDQFNNLITTDNRTLTLAIASGPQDATLSGKLAVQASKGTAKFSITPQAAGDFTLTISDGTLAPVTTNSFNVYFVPKRLAVTPPTAGAIGLAIPSFTVRILDAKGRTVTTSSALVTLTVTSPTGAVFHGAPTATAVQGVATFSNLTVDAAGTYLFKFTSDPLTFATLRVVV